MFERKYLFLIYIFFSAMFSACGGSGATDPDEVSSSNSMANGTNLAANADYSVEAYESLPVCNDRKDGQTGYVKGTSKYYVCEDGEWVVTNKPSSPSTSINEDDSSHDDGDVGKGKSSSSRSNSIPDFFGKSSESSGISVGGSDPSTGILTDSRDGQKYKTTKIGEQVWMAENLNIVTEESWCYDDYPFNCEKYGRLYTSREAQTVCPAGWHLPSVEEYRMLLKEVGRGTENASANLRASPWENGEDKYGFSARPAGSRDCYSSFHDEGNIGGRASFWCSCEFGDGYFELDSDEFSIYCGAGGCGNISVRCLKDN